MGPIGTAIVIAGLAQEAGGQSASFIIDLITNVGIGGVFLFLYFDERKERRATQALNNQLLERVLPLIAEATTTLERVQESQIALRQADTQVLEKRLDELAAEIRKGQGD